MRLSAAAIDLIREVGYDELTLPAVAARAGVARATAYTYFSSKEHLVADAYWRRISTETAPPPDGADPAERVIAVLQHVAMIVADDPLVESAVSVALRSADPEVDHLRLEIGRHMHSLIAAAAGPGVDTEDVVLVELAYAGAMVYAGAGRGYGDLAAQISRIVHRVLG